MTLVSKITANRFAVRTAVFVGVCIVFAVALRVGLSKKRIQGSIARSSGMKVEFEDFSVGILGQVDLKRVTASRPNGDSLSAESVSARPNLWSGLKGRLRFEEVRVQGVRFVRMERSKTLDAVEKPKDGTVAEVRLDGGRSASGVRDILRLARSIEVSNAGVDWMKANGSIRTQLEGIGFKYKETGVGEGLGELKVQRGMWQEFLAVDSLEAKMSLKGDLLSVSDFAANCGGGRLAGSASLQFDTAAPFKMKVSAEGVDLESMSRELPSLRISGKAAANLELEGLLEEQSSWVGLGEVTVNDGMFKGLALLQMLGQVFQAQELVNLKARKAHSKIRIARRKVALEGLHIDAGDVQLSAPGEVDFKRALSLQAQISIPENMIRGKALQLFDKRFSPPDAGGRRSLAFHVSGSLEKPRTDLVEKLVGDNLGEIVGGALGGVFEQFLGGLLKPRKASKTEAKPEAGGEAPAKPQ